MHSEAVTVVPMVAVAEVFMEAVVHAVEAEAFMAGVPTAAVEVFMVAAAFAAAAVAHSTEAEAFGVVVISAVMQEPFAAMVAPFVVQLV